MSGYYDHSSGDKDARDFIAIQREKRLREDKDPVTSKEPGIGSFEKHTKVRFEQHNVMVGFEMLNFMDE